MEATLALEAVSAADRGSAAAIAEMADSVEGVAERQTAEAAQVAAIMLAEAAMALEAVIVLGASRMAQDGNRMAGYAGRKTQARVQAELVPVKRTLIHGCRKAEPSMQTTAGWSTAGIPRKAQLQK
jgi:hypothetical protein